MELLYWKLAVLALIGVVLCLIGKLIGDKVKIDSLNAEHQTLIDGREFWKKKFEYQADLARNYGKKLEKLEELKMPQ